MSYGPSGALTDAAARRMSNQIARVFRGTYGATTGLQTIMTSLARQMLVAGQSPDTIAQTFTHCVLAHSDGPGAESRNAESRMLLALTRQCVAQAALEAEMTPKPAAKPAVQPAVQPAAKPAAKVAAKPARSG